MEKKDPFSNESGKKIFILEMNRVNNLGNPRFVPPEKRKINAIDAMILRCASKIMSRIRKETIIGGSNESDYFTTN